MHIDNKQELDYYREKEKTKRVLMICKTLRQYEHGTNVNYPKEVHIEALKLLETIYKEESK